MNKKELEEATKDLESTEVVTEVVEVEETKKPVKKQNKKEEADTSNNGVVSGCQYLRVRREPEIADNVFKEISEGTKVAIIREESTDEFYKVVTETGETGFVMKQYIKLK